MLSVASGLRLRVSRATQFLTSGTSRILRPLARRSNVLEPSTTRTPPSPTGAPLPGQERPPVGLPSAVVGERGPADTVVVPPTTRQGL